MSEKPTKRKRHSTDVNGSRKRRSVEPSSGQISVTIRDGNSTSRPVLASAPGIDLKSTAFDLYTKPAEKDGSESVLLHSADHPRLDYTATADIRDPVQHVLGVYDPTKQTLELFLAEALTVRSTLWQETLDVQVQNAERSRLAQREALGMEFGTKKAKKAIASKTINAINAGTVKGVEEATLSGINSSSGLPSREEREEEVLKSKPIPTPNLDAEQVKDVYTLDTLIPPADLRAQMVKEWQDAVQAGNEVQVSSRYVANRLQRVVERKDVQRLKSLKYLLLLIEFANTLGGSRGGRKVPKRDQLKEKLSSWSEPAIDSMRRRFAEGSDLNKWHFDRLMTHAAAISLYIDGWKTEISDLREDLRQDNRQMSQYFHELGCKTRNPYESEHAELKIHNKLQAAQKKIAYLKIPLDFPKTRNPPRRR